MKEQPLAVIEYQCANCEWIGSELNEIKDIYQRVDPGEVMPDGECPVCGALAYKLDEPTERDRILGDIAALHRLHAAAPALLHACNAALAYLADPPSEYRSNRIAAAAIIRAAIAMTEPPKPQ